MRLSAIVLPRVAAALSGGGGRLFRPRRGRSRAAEPGGGRAGAVRRGRGAHQGRQVRRSVPQARGEPAPRPGDGHPVLPRRLLREDAGARPAPGPSSSRSPPRPRPRATASARGPPAPAPRRSSPRLPRLRIVLGAATRALPGLEVRSDGVRLLPVAYGVPIPVDLGEHVVRVEARGKAAWETRVTVGEPAQKVEVTVPCARATLLPRRPSRRPPRAPGPRGPRRTPRLACRAGSGASGSPRSPSGSPGSGGSPRAARSG